MDDDPILAEADAADADDDDTLVDRAREMPVGTMDPNIIGDAGPTDVPPGTDPPSADEDDLGPSEPL
jgi:hypothetical protein